MWDREISNLLSVLADGFPAVETMDGAQARAAFAARRAVPTNLDDVADALDRTIPGPVTDIPVRIYRPHGPPRARPLNVFLHGGGFVFCDLDSHDGFCREMARMTDSIVVSVDYRLAPEAPAPAAALDALAALDWVAEHAAELGGDPSRLVVSGDSAGGNLAAVIARAAAERGGPALAAQVLIYPVIDPACAADSYRRYAVGYVNTAAAMRWYWDQYLPDGRGGPLPEPAALVVPTVGSLPAGLPPALVVTAGLDPLADEGADYATRLAAAGVPVIRRDYAGTFHGFVTIGPLRAARSARTVLWRDLRRLLAVAAPAPGPDDRPTPDP